MYIQVYDICQLEHGLNNFNKIIEQKGAVTVHDICSITFWNGPFTLEEIKNKDIMESLNWRIATDERILLSYGWNEKVDYSEIRKELIPENDADRINRHHCFTLTLPEPKELD